MSRLSSFLELVKAPQKIISQNGKLMALPAIIYLIINPIIITLFTLSTKPYILDLTEKLIALASSRPGTPEFTELLVAIREETGIFLGIEAVYVAVSLFVAFFAHTTIIIISSCYYTGYELSFKQLIATLSKTWTRPLVTSIWVQVVVLGYTSFFVMIFVLSTLVLFDHPIILIPVLLVLIILFLAFNIYLSVVWSLAVVVSVVEDSRGFLALGKAIELVNGKIRIGILLNSFYMLVFSVIMMPVNALSPAMPIVAGVIQVLLIGVVAMFVSMSYTGYYFHCENGMKKSTGSEYSRLPNAPLVDESLP